MARRSRRSLAAAQGVLGLCMGGLEREKGEAYAVRYQASGARKPGACAPEGPSPRYSRRSARTATHASAFQVARPAEQSRDARSVSPTVTRRTRRSCQARN